MNRAEAMVQLGGDLGLTPPPSTLAGLVAAAGGTRAAAVLLGAPSSIPRRPANGVKFSAEERAERNRLLSPQRTLQRYQRAEAGEKGKNVRGQNAAERQALIDKLREAIKPQWQRQQKADIDSRFPRGFHVKVKGNFFVSSGQEGRTVKPVYIPRVDMDTIIDDIQADDYVEASKHFDDAYGNSYEVPNMRWGEDDLDAGAFDSLEID